jgi:hypothetical protein
VGLNVEYCVVTLYFTKTFKAMAKVYETLKMERTVMDAVRYQKSQTGVPVSVFITQAVIEKLERQVKDKPTKKQ